MKSVQGSTPLEPLAAVCISRGPLGAVSEQSRSCLLNGTLAWCLAPGGNLSVCGTEASR